MNRKPKVTQEAVEKACIQLKESGKSVTVNAVISITGGSFSTVGGMVKQWKKTQAEEATPVIEIPESVSKSMKKATFEIWKTASTLANEATNRIQKEAEEKVQKAHADLAEYENEVSRLEKELKQRHQEKETFETKQSQIKTELEAIKRKNILLETRLEDRDEELKRLQTNFENLQNELIKIAKKEKVA